MAWTAPTDRITSDIITAAQWNTFLGATGDMSLTATGIVTTQGDTVYATAANTLARLAKGTAYQALAMNAGATAPSWQASPTSTLTATGDVLYASAANTLAKLPIGSSSQVLTVAAGVPSWATASAPGSTVPATTTGQTLFASATNVLSALAVGTAYQTLAMNSGATLPTWQASPTSALTTTGDVLYASAANTLARRGIGSTGQVLTVVGGVPTWATPGGGMKKVTGTGYKYYPSMPSLGTSLSASNGSYGSYVEITGSTGSAIYITGTNMFDVSMGGGATRTTGILATGAAASETAISEVGYRGGDNNNTVLYNTVAVVHPFPFVVPVATATRIAFKAAATGGSSSNIYVVVQYIAQADLIDA